MTRRLLRRGDVVSCPGGIAAVVVDVHRDKRHVSVLPGVPFVRRLVRFDVESVVLQ